MHSGAAVRFALTTVVLMLIGYILPGFSRLTFGEAVLVALGIGALGYGIRIFLRPDIPGRVRGVIGGIAAWAGIWLAQFIVPHMHVALIAELLTAVVIGLINSAIPNAVA